MTIFWPGLVAVFGLYVAVFLVGVWAGNQSEEPSSAEELLLAGRSLPLWVGLLTMTATWVGGGYINGTAEYTYSLGILWGGQIGFGYAISLVVGGLFYAKRMRSAGYATLVDPLEDRYGRHIAALLMIPAVIAEVFWSAAILFALGTTFGTVIGVDTNTAVLLSSTVAVAYTVFGGLRAVAYTDVVQLFLIVLGLGLAIPWALGEAGGVSNLHLKGLTPQSTGEALSWLDYTALLVMGGIPWNVYFQRVLSARTPADAQRLSIAAGVMCFLMAIPPMLLGLAGTSIDWVALSSAAGLEPARLANDLAATPALVLPYTLRYAVPVWVGVVGLGAVSAAVMSSVDSSILSAASLAAWNGYRRLFRPDLDGPELTRVVRILVAALGGSATVIALNVGSVAALWLLCGDIVYSVLFPQLTLALFDRSSNRAGALAGLLVSVVLRLSGGEPTLGIPAFLPWPSMGAYPFPFRTIAMLGGLVTAIVVARATAGVDPPRPLRNGPPE
ncbi:MAG: sodium:solute symporter family protein [Alphaproteobacteria bacterium]|nr:sodium:solute symporter family protein [Alphaproteobacteria bacterium]